MEKNIALEALIARTNRSLGYVPSTPSEFNELSLLIFKKTGRTLSLSSIKRIWGYVKYEGFPSLTTLNTLSHYNGYDDWITFLQAQSPLASDPHGDSGFIAGSSLDSTTLLPGDKIILSWDEGAKGCDLECIAAGGRFRVASSHNIKLIPDDELTLATICAGHPLYAADIVRNNLLLGAYVGAKRGGVGSIIVHRIESESSPEL